MRDNKPVRGNDVENNNDTLRVLLKAVELTVDMKTELEETATELWDRAATIEAVTDELRQMLEKEKGANGCNLR